MDTHFWFFYIGIFLFVTQIILQGISFDLSYFGILLIYLGWKKIEVWFFFKILLWIFIIVDVLATIYRLQEKVKKYLDPDGKISKYNDLEDFVDEEGDNEEDDNEEEEDDNEEEEDDKESEE